MSKGSISKKEKIRRLKEGIRKKRKKKISTGELKLVVGMSAVSIVNFVACFRDRIESTVFHLCPSFMQSLMLIHCSKEQITHFCDET
jgi:hypothetical protein